MTTKPLSNLKTKVTDQAFLTHCHKNTQKIFQIDNFFTLGRSDTNTYTLDDPYLSKRHCRIEKRIDGYFLKDLRSSNGTLLNNVNILRRHITLS